MYHRIVDLATVCVALRWVVSLRSKHNFRRGIFNSGATCGRGAPDRYRTSDTWQVAALHCAVLLKCEYLGLFVPFYL